MQPRATTDLWQHSGGPLGIVAYLPAQEARWKTIYRAVGRALITHRYQRDTTDWIDNDLADELLELFAAQFHRV